MPPPIGSQPTLLPQSRTRINRIPPIHHEIHPIEILIRHTKQHRLRHILLPPRPSRRHLLLELPLRDLTLLVLPAFPRRHLTREHARRDRVNSDLDPIVRRDLGREQLRQVDRRAFTRVVGEVVLRGLDEAGDGGDVDDGPGVAGVQVGCFGEEGEEGGGHEEELRDVGGVGGRPHLDGLVRVVEEVGGQFGGGGGFGCLAVEGDAGVVDKHVEGLLAGGDVGDEVLNRGFGGYVGGDGDDFAYGGEALVLVRRYHKGLFCASWSFYGGAVHTRDVLAIRFHDRVELLRRSAHNIYLSSISCKSLRCHQPNACENQLHRLCRQSGRHRPRTSHV